MLLEQNLQKEVDQITPFLKFGSAAKEAKLAFALKMVWENSINSAVRRIYSGCVANYGPHPRRNGVITWITK